MVNSFDDKNIIKCAIDGYNSIFLEDNGVLWTWCYSGNGRLGLVLNENEFTRLDCYVFKPTKISFFVKEKIVIKNIKCGEGHNIALDINGDVFSW